MPIDQTKTEIEEIILHALREFDAYNPDAVFIRKIDGDPNWELERLHGDVIPSIEHRDRIHDIVDQLRTMYRLI